MIKRFETFSQTLFRLTRCWNQIAGEEMRKHGLKGPYAIYIVTLHQSQGELTASELCRLCGKDKADVSRALAMMEKEGLISRESSYRGKISLTEKGLQIASFLDGRAILAMEMAGKGITQENRQAFYQVLGLIAQNMEELSKDGLPSIKKGDQP